MNRFHHSTKTIWRTVMACILAASCSWPSRSAAGEELTDEEKDVIKLTGGGKPHLGTVDEFANFVSRSNEENLAIEYLQSPGGRPLVLHGASGSGKTASWPPYAAWFSNNSQREHASHDSLARLETRLLCAV